MDIFIVIGLLGASALLGYLKNNQQEIIIHGFNTKSGHQGT